VVARLSGESEVVETGDAEHGVVDTVAFEATVTEDLPGLHAGKDVLHAGADLFVRLVVCFSPAGQFLACAAAVGHDGPGAWIAAVSDRHSGADGALGSGLFPCLAVVAVAGKRPTDHDDQATVGVDDNLMVGGVSVVLIAHR
jgi:hypothetical protein